MKMRSLVSLFGCTALIAVLSTSFAADRGGPTSHLKASDLVPVSVSEDMSHVLLTTSFKKGLTLVDTDSGKVSVVSRESNAGQYASISPDGKFVFYKTFKKDGDNFLQIAMVYDIAARRNKALCSPLPLVGTPGGAANGKVAFTKGGRLVILNPNLTEAAGVELGNHVNLLSLSSDASKVAFNDADDQLQVLDVATGVKTPVTSGDTSYWGPQFSPKGDRLLANTADGRIVTAIPGSGFVKVMGVGENASWADNDTVVFTKKTVVAQNVLKTELVSAGISGESKAVLDSEPGDASAAVSKGSVALAQGERLRYGYIKQGAVQLVDLRVPVIPYTSTNDLSKGTVTGDVAGSHNVVDYGTYVSLTNVPYLHQLNDTPDYWNGNSCCGASSALMAINYYNILAKHPITCSWPSSHTSDYGWYVPEIYSFNGHTYNLGSADPNGRIGYGGFGYITQNGWADTKGHMAEYISYHGPTSGVDWSPSMAKARSETNANHPFVLLSTITSAGHYKACIGAFKSQNTLIFNDPYGNKNSGSYPSDDGRNVRYDWPGYSNGYQNLNTAPCFIWCRFSPPSTPTGLAATAVSASQINLTWTDVSYCESSYEVWRSTTSGSGYAKVATLGANATSYSNTGLAGNTTYYYVVKACNGSGCSANSNEANAHTSAGISDIIVDNSASGFTASANWITGTSASDKYGTDYRYRSTAAISDQAIWSFSIGTAGNYEMYAWWSAGTNRSASASYTLPDATTKACNQQANGGVWNSLGTKSLATGTNTIKLSCWTTTGYVVVADAVKVVAR